MVFNLGTILKYIESPGPPFFPLTSDDFLCAGLLEELTSRANLKWGQEVQSSVDSIRLGYSRDGCHGLLKAGL